MKAARYLQIVLVVVSCVSLNLHAQTNDPCNVTRAIQGKQESLKNQIANERNPIRRDDLNAQLAQSNSASNAALENLVNVEQGRFANLSGRVTAFGTVGYNTGPGAQLGITLSCGIAIGFQFVEIRNPDWGNMTPRDQTPLVPWRRALETIVVGDTVTFSGRFSGYGGSEFGAVLTRLQKRGGTAFEVADAYMPASSTKLISHAGLSWIPAVNEGTWQQAQTYCAQLSLNGQAGWRMPAQHELQNLLASGAAGGQRWQTKIWTSSPWPREWPYTNPGWYAVVDITTGRAFSAFQTEIHYGISCVLGAPSAPPPKLVYFKEGMNDTDRQQAESRCSMDEINGQLKGQTWADCMMQHGWQLRSPEQYNSADQVTPPTPEPPIPSPPKATANVGGAHQVSRFDCVRSDDPSVTTTLVVDFTNNTVKSLNGFGGIGTGVSVRVTDSTISWRNQVIKNYGGGGIQNFAGSIDRATRDFTFTTATNSILKFTCR
jgi:hypothetical protein